METGTHIEDINSASPLPSIAGRPLTQTTITAPVVTTSSSEGQPSVTELVIRGTVTTSVTITIDIADSKAKYENFIANSAPVSIETSASYEA